MLSINALFLISLFPYLGFLWFLTYSKETPRLALIGFYCLLLFILVTIPSGIIAKIIYKEELANIDWLHGGAELFLTLSNTLIVFGFYEEISKYKKKQK